MVTFRDVKQPNSLWPGSLVNIWWLSQLFWLVPWITITRNKRVDGRFDASCGCPMAMRHGADSSRQQQHSVSWLLVSGDGATIKRDEDTAISSPTMANLPARLDPGT